MYVQFIPTYSTYSRLLQPHRSDLNLQLKQSHLRIGISSPKTSIMVAAAYTHQLYFVTAAARRDGMGIDSAEVHVGVEAEIRNQFCCYSFSCPPVLRACSWRHALEGLDWRLCE